MIVSWARRYSVVALTSLACVICYSDRVNISVAAVAMREQFQWSQTEKGLVLSAFFLGYLLFMFLGGVLATRIGGRIVLGCAVLAWSLFTLLTPPAAMTSLAVLIAARIGMGLGEAPMFPAGYDLFGRWVPERERARAVAWLMSGIPLGTIIGLAGSAWLVAKYGWPMTFYVFGLVGLLWLTVWFPQVTNDPAQDPRLNAAERALLPVARASSAAARARLPFAKLLRAPVLAIVAGHFALTWSLYVLLSWLPSYFRDVQHLSIAHAGLFSAAPWLTMFAITIAAGSLSDRMVGRGASTTSMRKLMQCGGLLLSALFLLATRNAHSPGTALLLLCGGTGALGCSWSGFAPSVLDVAPRHSALLHGFSNSFATIPGIVGVAVIGWLIDVTGTYSAAFVLTASVSLVGAILFWWLFDARPVLG